MTTGDFLVLGNHRAVHSRASIAARYDGTDGRPGRISGTHDLRESADPRRPASARPTG